MLLQIIIVDIIRNTGYNTWYDFLGNLDNETRFKSNGETDYLVFNPNKEEIQISLPLGKDRIGELAKLELEEILREAGIKTIADLYTKIKGLTWEKITSWNTHGLTPK